jgi:prevent-host-death family protein
MIKLHLKEATGHLEDLIEEAVAGQEVVIISAHGPRVRLVPVSQADENEAPVATAPVKTVGHALDRFIGTWSAEQEAEVLDAVEAFEHIDESLWQ